MTESTPQTESARTPTGFLESFIGIFGQLFAFFAGAATILYALGFVIVNTSLLQHGVYELRLVQAQFVAAGLYYLFYLALLVSIAIGVHALVRWICKEWRRPWPYPREGEGKPNPMSRLLNLLTLNGRFIDEWVVIVLDIIFSPPVFLFLLANTIWRLWTAPGPSRLSDFEAVFTWAWMTLTLAWLYVLVIRPWIADRVTTIGRMEVLPAGRVALEAVVLFLVLMPTLFLYSQNVYHRIPLSFGGGSPMIVQFVVDKEDARLRLQAFGVVTNQLGLTEKVELIAQSENRFIVLTQQEERAVSLNTKDVQAIVYYIDYRGTAQRYNEVGVQRARDGRYKDAIPQYDQAILLDEGFLPAYINRGVAYLETAKQEMEKGQEKVQEPFKGYPKIAKDDFQRVIDDTQDKCPALAEAIQAAEKDSTELIDAALSKCPALLQAIQLPREDFPQAIDVAAMRGDRERVLHLAFYHYARACAIQEELPREKESEGAPREEQWKEAVEYLLKAIALEQSDYDAVWADHDFQPFLSQPEFVKKIFGSFENAAREYGIQATDRKQEGKSEEAEWSYRRALELIQCAYDKATEADEKNALLSDKASYYTGLADLYTKQAKWDLAVAEYEKAITDTLKAGKYNVAYLYRSQLVEALYSGGQLERAIPICDKWREQFAVHPPGAIACGNVYRDSQDFGNALDSYTQAISYTQTISYTQIISTTTDLVEAYYQRARLHAKQSEVELFLQYLAKGTKLNYSLIARSASEPDFSAFQGDSRFRRLLYPNIERIEVKDETTLEFNLPAPNPAFQFQLIALMRLEGLPPPVSYSVSEDELVWTVQLQQDTPYKASELQAQILQIASLMSEAKVPSEPTLPPVRGYGGGLEHTVSFGDDLEKLADKFLGNPSVYPAIIYYTNLMHAQDPTLAEITDPSLLEPGSKIYIPSVEEVEAYFSVEAPK